MNSHTHLNHITTMIHVLPPKKPEEVLVFWTHFKLKEHLFYVADKSDRFLTKPTQNTYQGVCEVRSLEHGGVQRLPFEGSTTIKDNTDFIRLLWVINSMVRNVPHTTFLCVKLRDWLSKVIVDDVSHKP